VQAQSSNLYVGSVKTAIGHTEGTAGLAGMLKASQAVRHGIIPPNRLFERLSSKVAPFYTGLEIATKAKPWPNAGPVRRASVNSFGFGGANAHVILENHEPSIGVTKEDGGNILGCTPFVFSAASETALERMLEAYATHLRGHPHLSPRDLSYTLHTRRSALGVRVAFPAAASAQQLASGISEHLDLVRARRDSGEVNSGLGIGTRPVSSTPRILGVFTGQGAQWATMGRELIQGSAFVQDRIRHLEKALSSLPTADRPSWSLADELLADSESSRLGEAGIAQPLCTVIQIVLVDLLRAADIEFAAVVGHSSGEIAAAYAAGMITAEDAIRIAYYRGLCVERFAGTEEGAMMAVGTSLEDATELCGLESFAGRLCVAACNSPSSITLSGDLAAIQEAKVILDDEQKFARRLKVDKAYHSHHMAPCAAPYQRALQACNIQPREPGNQCAWYSSVYPGTRMGTAVGQLEDLKGEYWKDNLLRPVLFAQALETAVAMNKTELFNMVIEVGPHSALKGPASESLASLYDQEQLPPPQYCGTLHRGSGDLAALSGTLGSLWCRFTKRVVNFSQYDALVTGQSGALGRAVANLPTYQWDHDRVFWHDSRVSRAIRNRTETFNPLLGTRVPDGVGDEMRWRNIIRPSELPWIQGHRLQGQMVYPAAAYLSTVVESCALLAGGRPVSTIEIRDLELGKALVFDGTNDQPGAETLFALSNIARPGQNHVTASFTFHAAIGADADTLSRLATGRVLVTLTAGDASEEANTRLQPPLPQQATSEPAGMADVEEEAFYSSLEKLGYEYSGDFVGLSDMKRKINYGSAHVRVPSFELAADAMLVHPALLDAALQGIFLAYWYPDDGSLEQLHVPTRIASVTINASLCRQELPKGGRLPLASFLTVDPLAAGTIEGDVDVLACDGQTPLIQVQGGRLLPLAQPTSQADRQLFREHVWGPSVPDGALAADNRATPQDYELAVDLERISLFYMKKLVQDVPAAQRQGLEWHHEALFDFFEHVLEQATAGRVRFVEKEWLDDTWDEISRIIDKYPGRIEIALNHTVGENLAAAVRGETQILQHMFKDNLLNRFYVESMGLRETTSFLARIVAQITHRYPHMDILEIGAGTGGATKAVLRDIGRTFSTYTFTDISTGFMEKAQETFSAVADKMVFKALDVEKDVVEQGYGEHSYDLVIGSLVLHATKSLEKTMRETRRLLKPGGYLILLEITDNDVLRVGFSMSGLPGWWLGREDGRQYSPCVSSARWHEVLLATGFSGIDTITPEVDTLPRPFGVIVSQAVDERFDAIRKPLSYPVECNAAASDKGELVIIGGQRLATAVLIDSVLDLTQQFGFNVTRLSSLSEVSTAGASPTALVLNLAELDQPVFRDLTSETLEGMQCLVDYQRTILWVTQGCRADEPYMNMSVGLGRTLALEAAGVRLQFLDLDSSRKPDARLVAETLLRLRFTREEAPIHGLLYSREQELVEEEGRVLVPRLLSIQAANGRHNASKRHITQARDAQECGLVLTTAGSGYAFREETSNSAPSPTPDRVLVRVAASSLFPLTEQMYGVVGQDCSTGAWVMGLSRTNGTRVTVQQGHIVPIASPEDDNVTAAQQQLLALLTVEAQCHRILNSMPPEGIVVVNEPPADLALRLLEKTTTRGLNVVFTVTTVAARDALPGHCSVVVLSPHTLRRAVRAAVPPNVALLVDCSPEPEGVGLGSLVASCMPPSCRYMALREVGSQRQGPPAAASMVLEMLQDAVARHTQGLATKFEYHALSPSALVGLPPANFSNPPVPTLIDWKSGDTVPVKVQSVDNMMHFDGTRSYVLFGLTSDLGRSLVEWMASRGAKNIALTSRDPVIDTDWLEECRAKGIRVEVFAK